MSYTPPGQIPLYAKELVKRQLDVVVIPIGTEITNAIELAKWQIIKKPGALDVRFFALIIILIGELKRIAGAGNVSFSLEESDDDIVWSPLNGFSTTSAVFVAIGNSLDNQAVSLTTRFIRIAAYASDATTSGELQNAVGYINIILPQGWIPNRLI